MRRATRLATCGLTVLEFGLIDLRGGMAGASFGARLFRPRTSAGPAEGFLGGSVGLPGGNGRDFRFNAGDDWNPLGGSGGTAASLGAGADSPLPRLAGPDMGDNGHRVLENVRTAIGMLHLRIPHATDRYRWARWPNPKG